MQSTEIQIDSIPLNEGDATITLTADGRVQSYIPMKDDDDEVPMNVRIMTSFMICLREEPELIESMMDAAEKRIFAFNEANPTKESNDEPVQDNG